MLPKFVKEKLRRLATAATPGPRELSPRSIGCQAEIDKGVHPIDVAAADQDDFLGWEIEDGLGFRRPARGDFTGPDAALIMATGPEMVLSLLDEIERLEQEHAA